MDKALTGMMYAVNAKKNKWIENVELIFFGPSEKMIASSESGSQVTAFLKQAIDLGITPVACKAVSDRNEITPKLAGLGLEVEYVGAKISSLINNDFQVLTF